ncbi:hypothetical protein HWB05_gp017 [Streptomyces phage BRock]|uniref:Uncharacterized protein n=1 Tax=Streptomyces phage BRock TaxID=1913591 RepID=A0A1J0GVR6_9CAUD|nr:hypothetical protein HWB05_gp017 [Streptomyces phage BRock]APC46279.1 hypothetical protein [Streptomyces phage BRock]
MATYNGWTELREYRVWMGEETYSVVTVERHRNGWYRVYEDGGSDWSRSTRSGTIAFDEASNRAEWLQGEAADTCPCQKWAEVEQVDCYSPELNPYNSAHGIRLQVVDMIENRELEFYEL